MKRNMMQWVQDMIAAPVKQPLPVLSFPAIQLMGITVKDLIADSDRQAKGMVEVARRVPAAASVSLMDLSVEAECFGSTIRVTEDEVPAVIGAVISDEDEANEMAVPPIGAGRTGIYIDAIRKAAAEITDRPIFAGIIGPFSLAARLMDVSETMYYCYDEPDMVHTTLRKATDFLIAYCKAYKEAGANGIVMAEPVAGLLSPALAEEFSNTYVKQVVDAVQEESFIVIYHNCGSSVAKMPQSIFALGAMGYHFGNAIDMEDMLPYAPADVLVMGNVDPAAQLRNGTPESVAAATVEVMEKCCKYPNFVISSGCDIPPMAPWANLDAFFAAAEGFYKK